MSKNDWIRIKYLKYIWHHSCVPGLIVHNKNNKTLKLDFERSQKWIFLFPTKPLPCSCRQSNHMKWKNKKTIITKTNTFQR
jgi:hypothetical protein